MKFDGVGKAEFKTILKKHSPIDCYQGCNRAEVGNVADCSCLMLPLSLPS